MCWASEVKVRDQHLSPGTWEAFSVRKPVQGRESLELDRLGFPAQGSSGRLRNQSCKAEGIPHIPSGSNTNTFHEVCV